MVEKERFTEHETCEQKGQCYILGECWRAHLIDVELGYVKDGVEDSRRSLNYVTKKAECKHPQALDSLDNTAPYMQPDKDKRLFFPEEMGETTRIEFTDDFLEPREREIIAGVIMHKKHKDIAEVLGLSKTQVGHSIERIKQKVQKRAGIYPFDTRKAIFDLISMGVLSIERGGIKNEL